MENEISMLNVHNLINNHIFFVVWIFTVGEKRRSKRRRRGGEWNFEYLFYELNELMFVIAIGDYHRMRII